MIASSRSAPQTALVGSFRPLIVPEAPFTDLPCAPSLARFHFVQIARKIDFADEQVLFYVRCAYVGAQLAVLAVYYFISMQVSLGVLEHGGLETASLSRVSTCMHCHVARHS